MRRAHGGALDPELLDFSVSVNPLGPPSSVIVELARDPLARAQRYPSPDARELREAIAAHHGISPECVLPGNGASELIDLCARQLSGRRAYVEVPAYTEYEDACRVHGVTLKGEASEADAAFSCNPSCPMGLLTPRSSAPPDAPLRIVDESFMPFIDESESRVAEAAEDRSWIVLRSLTKIYAIPGLRVGYAIAHPDRVRKLGALQPPWSVNAFAIAAAVAALRDEAYLAHTRKQVATLRSELREGLRQQGLAPSDACANYVCCRVPDAAALCRVLLRHGIAARDCTSFSGLERNRYVRFAVRPRSEQAILLSALSVIAAASGPLALRAPDESAESAS